ncbi:MAG TPA: hypothetical protein VF612_04095 [Jatrophihabitans sp.]|jgi:hypothetical protein|uniref:hypothetical protein n=1 Tax=Jatrophihabitans sp. TaxID=1932789 RepID=UPI002EE37E31
MTSPAEAALVDGVDVDAVAAAVRSCPAVHDLDGGRLGGVATYLPGRRVPGIRIEDDRLEVHVRGVWGQPVGELADQIRSVLAALSGGRIIDVVLTDVAEPGQARAQLPSSAEPAATVAPAVLADGTVEQWTTPNAPVGPSGGNSSAATIPTAAETRPTS